MEGCQDYTFLLGNECTNASSLAAINCAPHTAGNHTDH
jgi:hypothetical protein